ncbi:bifunctional UDP-N-acetylglucosamine diphosphorylase/glucosamine-1-phosphate N-acetyltransferase GlmU [Tropicimonas sp. TH_r6]|uniref:bifunctional UDP-N-acetylglucosamine diphosphorylase/glucosamine-1-phosphate N-acetyltransferase GlmU n=1 Tax=Tropicimonas sp. TH_r6 TaxID=3082085 RepID=UPI0029555156|nr:bifunctional UDP-N-acetylglucosamine diphosphorylase/glucosamine-1-phosphate N-acetyltransferase GlmU [Tropicimonas sp. TH_r6]MDV7141794.1 bifunctional UDP-N-acetylglucosamine diphosphorylase/glucosamine-1-phosphate N-acetyltransferase GlmU [Tropicimonas sp. TH_r6]
MSVSRTALVILAAGQGTRMKSDLPKVLHKVAGAPLLHHAMLSGASLDPERSVIVAGHGAEAVQDAALELDPDAITVVQADRLGTGHAADQAREALADFDGNVIVLYGDTPFIRTETLDAMVAAREKNAVVVLGFEPEDPARYGRLVMKGEMLERIVEYKDATDEERAIGFCNSGVICADSKLLFDLISEIGNDNASGEYYLTDIVDRARARALAVTAVTCAEEETMGVNSRVDLARAEAAYQARRRTEALVDGVAMQAPETVFLSFDTVIGRDAEIEPNVVFGPGVTVETGARIRAFSHLEGCHVSRGAIVGPYARLRPGAELAEDTHIGNFVEIKNAQIAEGAKVNHLTYIGDASIGAATNIGAGTITCNYDGVFKHRTEIGAKAFIGSNTMLVAPVKIGDEAMTATGAVVTKDVPDGALAVARAKQDNKPGFAIRFMERLRALKLKATEE